MLAAHVPVPGWATQQHALREPWCAIPVPSGPDAMYDAINVGLEQLLRLPPGGGTLRTYVADALSTQAGERALTGWQHLLAWLAAQQDAAGIKTYAFAGMATPSMCAERMIQDRFPGDEYAMTLLSMRLRVYFLVFSLTRGGPVMLSPGGNRNAARAAAEGARQKQRVDRWFFVLLRERDPVSPGLFRYMTLARCVPAAPPERTYMYHSAFKAHSLPRFVIDACRELAGAPVLCPQFLLPRGHHRPPPNILGPTANYDDNGNDDYNDNDDSTNSRHRHRGTRSIGESGKTAHSNDLVTEEYDDNNENGDTSNDEEGDAYEQYNESYRRDITTGEDQEEEQLQKHYKHHDIHAPPTRSSTSRHKTHIERHNYVQNNYDNYGQVQDRNNRVEDMVMTDV